MNELFLNFSHYIEIDSNNNITKVFSDAFEQPTENSICINTKGGRHFELLGVVNPQLQNANGCFLYQYVNNEVIKKTDEEIATESLPTLEEVQTQKLAEINGDCSKTIYAGVDVTTSLGVKHFSLQPNDQMQIVTLAGELQKAVQGLPSTVDITKGVPWHSDGDICSFWSPQDWANISKTAMDFAYYNTTYCNHLRVWIKRATSLDEVSEIQYGVALPDDLAAHLQTMLGSISA